MSIDHTKHSLFGASKVAADVLVQEYGRYFGMPTACFRGGCLTGPAHAGTELHGFLSYLMMCTVTGRPYRVFGYKGKQVRDNIHSYDLVEAFAQFFRAPRAAEVYNIGGSRHSNCSMLEAIELCEEISGSKLDLELRRGQPDRRPHLVDQRCAEIPGALSGMEFSLRPERDPGGNFRGDRFVRPPSWLLCRAGILPGPCRLEARLYIGTCSPSSLIVGATRSGMAQTWIMTAIQ